MAKEKQDAGSVAGDSKHEKCTMFKGYNLNDLEVPDQALPVLGREYKGSHSYTVCVEGAATHLKVFFLRYLCTY